MGRPCQGLAGAPKRLGQRISRYPDGRVELRCAGSGRACRLLERIGYHRLDPQDSLRVWDCILMHAARRRRAMVRVLQATALAGISGRSPHTAQRTRPRIVETWHCVARCVKALITQKGPDR